MSIVELIFITLFLLGSGAVYLLQKVLHPAIAYQTASINACIMGTFLTPMLYLAFQ